MAEDNQQAGRLSVAQLLEIKSQRIANNSSDEETESAPAVSYVSRRRSSSDSLALLPLKSVDDTDEAPPAKRARKSNSRFADDAELTDASVARYWSALRGQQGPVRNAVVVEQYDLETGATVRRYPSQREAAHSMRASHKAISKCCRGVKAEVNGFGYRYYSGPFIQDFEAENARLGFMSASQLRGMQRGRGGDERSASDDESDVAEAPVAAAKVMASSPPAPAQSKSPVSGASADGAPRTRQPSQGSKIVRMHSSNTKIEQFDLRSGETIAQFSTQSEAAHAIKGAQQVISEVCRGITPAAYGFGWRFVHYTKSAGVDDE